MSPKKKKTSTRRRRITPRKSPSGRTSAGKKKVRKSMTRPRRGPPRTWLRYLALFTGIIIGIGLPWMLWLNHVVTSEFEGRKWDLPSRVYARPLNLYAGLQISSTALQSELEAAGYRRQGSIENPGSYSASGGEYRIHRRGFQFDDGPQPALVFSVRVEDGAVAYLGSPAGQLDLVRLDPAEIASIYPLHDEDRTLVNIEQVPELLLTGLQAVEDRNFKSHPGIHLRGILRAVMANLRAGEAVQGGSTLTQQLVKNYYLSNERTLSRKLNEAGMALLLELHYEKAEILQAYLNEIYLGQLGNHGIHGFSRASEFYFGAPLESLDTAQIALLVGMVRGASLYNPRRNPERALERRNRVLRIFNETGLIGEQELEVALVAPLGVRDNVQTGRSRYPAFIDLVRRQLRSDYREDDLRNEGLRIFTTLAPFEQDMAEQAVISGMESLGPAVRSAPWSAIARPAGRVSTGRWMRGARSARWSSRWSTCWPWNTPRTTAC
jgi:penicillin-binding protein 1B